MYGQSSILRSWRQQRLEGEDKVNKGKKDWIEKRDESEIWKGDELKFHKARRIQGQKTHIFAKKQTQTIQPGKNVTKKTTMEFKKDSDARVGRWILLSRELGPPTFRDST